MLTPYLSGTMIDVEKVKQFIENAYRAARLQPEDIDTGAVIITARPQEGERPADRRVLCEVCGKIHLRGGGSQTTRPSSLPTVPAPSIFRNPSTRRSSMWTWEGTTKFSLIDHGGVTQTAAINIEPG